MTLLILWLLSRMALLSWADLSFVVPVTAIGYALSALAGQLLLHEAVGLRRWIGIAMIVAGVVLVGIFTPAHTYPSGRPRQPAAKRETAP